MNEPSDWWYAEHLVTSGEAISARSLGSALERPRERPRA